MNLLKGTRIYLAGNIEFTQDTIGWRDIVKERLGKIGVKILSPLEPMFVGQPHESRDYVASLTGPAYRANPDYVYREMSKIIAQDLRMIDLADIIIANVEVSRPTFGTVHEIVMSTQQKKPMFLNVQSKDNVPRWLAGLIKPSYIYESLDEVLTTLERIDRGELQVDSNNWRLLLPELR